MAVDLGISLFTSAGILLFLATITTLLRCIARIYVVKSFGLDDWLMILTLGVFAHYCAWIFYGRKIDQGRPDSEIPFMDVTPALRAFYLAEISYILAACLLKMSIGTFLLRIVKTKTQKCIIYTTLAVVFLYSMVSFMAAVFQCSPVRKFWQPLLPGTCLKKEVVLPLVFTHSAVIATSDFLFAILPMFVVWSLQMSRNMKISVSFLMGFGAIAGVTTISRIPFLWGVTTKENFFHNTAELAILSSIEPGLGIILGSAAATRPLFRTLITKTQATWYGARSHTHTHSTATQSALRRREIGRPFAFKRNSVRLNSFDASPDDVGKDFGEFGGARVQGGMVKAPTRVHIGDMGWTGDDNKAGIGRERRSEDAIYKDVTVTRVVEFLGRK